MSNSKLTKTPPGSLQQLGSAAERLLYRAEDLGNSKAAQDIKSVCQGIEILSNHLRAAESERDGADAVIESLKSKPLCPDCDSRMVRMQWQCEDGQYVAGWLCKCKADKYGKRQPLNDQAHLQPPRRKTP